MKVWKRKKREIARFRWALDDPRRNWMPEGYYKNRPALFRKMLKEIGLVDSVRFIYSP